MNASTSLDPLVLLRQMQADMAGQAALFQPTPFWQVASDRIIAELETTGMADFRRLAATRDFFVPSYGPPGNMLSPVQVERQERAILEQTAAGSKTHLTLRQSLNGEAWALADYRVFLAGDRPGIAPDLSRVSESTVGNPPDAFEIEGQRFSRSMLNYLHGLVFLKQQLGDSGIRTVLEIGGGYGTLGEILSQAGGDYTYVDVDIPPTSAVAAYYLSEQPGIELTDYETTRGEGPIPVPGPGRQMVLCPWQLPRLTGQVDLLWNFISFQEMEPDVVRFYLEQGARLGARYVLLRNMREGKQKRSAANPVGVDQPIRGEDYDGFLPGYRLQATNVFPFGYRTIDGFHSELRLYVKA
jgi:putative sugar O-methyltransferase